MGKIKSRKQDFESPIKRAIKEQQKASAKELQNDDCFLISFKHLDNRQSNSFKSWETETMLSECMDVLAGYSKQSLVAQLDGDKFTKYQAFPAHSEFTYPSYIPEDAEWARIHVNGKHIIAGHIVRNVFYIVFLDSEHKFWPTKKKHT